MIVGSLQHSIWVCRYIKHGLECGFSEHATGLLILVLFVFAALMAIIGGMFVIHRALKEWLA